MRECEETHCAGRIWCGSSSWRNTEWQELSSSRRTGQLQSSGAKNSRDFKKKQKQTLGFHPPDTHLVDGLDQEVVEQVPLLVCDPLEGTQGVVKASKQQNSLQASV